MKYTEAEIYGMANVPIEWEKANIIDNKDGIATFEMSIDREMFYSVSWILEISNTYGFGNIANIYKRVRRPEWKAQRIRGIYMVKGSDLIDTWIENPPFRNRGRRPIKK